MRDEKLDRALDEIFSQPIYPSEELVSRTKASLRKIGFFEYSIAASISLNLMGMFIFLYIIIFGSQSIFEKFLLFAAVSFIQNVVLLIICLYRDKIRQAFMTMEITSI